MHAVLWRRRGPLRGCIPAIAADTANGLPSDSTELPDASCDGLCAMHSSLPNARAALHASLSDACSYALWALPNAARALPHTNGALPSDHRELFNPRAALHASMPYSFGDPVRPMCDSANHLSSDTRRLPDPRHTLPSDTRSLPNPTRTLSSDSCLPIGARRLSYDIRVQHSCM